MHKIGILELVVILVIVLIIFGPKKLPKLSGSFRKSIDNFKQAKDSDKDNNWYLKSPLNKGFFIINIIFLI